MSSYKNKRNFKLVKRPVVITVSEENFVEYNKFLEKYGFKLVENLHWKI